MNTKIIWAVVIIVVLIAGGYWYVHSMSTSSAPAAQDQAQGKIAAGGGFGTYAYECDEHVTFTMTPADEMASITIAPADGASFPPAAVLAHVSAGTSGGQVFQGGGLTFTGKGESVTLASAGSDALNCSPVSNPDMAPFNFGD